VNHRGAILRIETTVEQALGNANRVTEIGMIVRMRFTLPIAVLDVPGGEMPHHFGG
jgi:hypothetical protein